MFGGIAGGNPVTKSVTTKSAPGAAKELMVTGLPPAFVRVTVVGAVEVPTTVSPNVMLEGFAMSEPGAGCVPFPISCRTAGESKAVLTIERLAVTAPTAVGEKLTLN